MAITLDNVDVLDICYWHKNSRLGFNGDQWQWWPWINWD